MGYWHLEILITKLAMQSDPFQVYISGIMLMLMQGKSKQRRWIINAGQGWCLDAVIYEWDKGRCANTSSGYHCS